jgi:hypothetical protein
MKFILYLLRWQISAVVTMPAMWFLKTYMDLGLYWNLMAISVFGGVIFFWVDRKIFSNEESLKREI